MSKYNIAIVGATGVVGQEIIYLLQKRAFQVRSIRLFASEKSAGVEILFHGEIHYVETLKTSSFEGVDFAFFCAGKTVSMQYVPEAVKAKCIVIDSSSYFRMDPSVPLVIPEINPEALKKHQGIVASPNCTASIMLMALAPLHRKFKIRRIVAATYQAASGAGAKAMAELEEETLAHLEKRPFSRSVMPFPYAFNLFLHNSPMTDNGYNEEEIKVVEESRKILNDPLLKISITCVRVPILRTHSEALNVEFEEDVSPDQARDLLRSATGICLIEEWAGNRFPMPLDATGQDDVFVGRIRRDLSQKNTLDFWVVGDQILKGAALNAVQIAEKLCPIH